MEIDDWYQTPVLTLNWIIEAVHIRKTTALRCLCIALKQRAILQLKAACLSLAGSNIQACCGVWAGSGNGAIGLENYTHACSARVYVRLKPMGKCPGNLMILADPGFIRKPSAGGLPRRNSGLRVSWTPGTSFLSQSVLWLCGARETRNQLFPTLGLVLVLIRILLINLSSRLCLYAGCTLVSTYKFK